ncbi:protein involved in polysaccharide export with SLBB domain [Marinomonas alcarazii]|uniref:Protein involved in polysaccharide export with SLBB domain n=1 Tax=Marinomonas alcarazii TaxID=491949 RepID=A0A318UWP0_9GAMM|nr:SLBB domain-containing protein [Marinomonas alcarazii]PYF79870.1 protein involved in polysaccharide export with SLBB domain [Marinomonas alcarazii]
MRFKKLLTALMMTLAGSVFAFTPTAAQISQFQNLPKAQQEALARQYGVDISAFANGSGGSVTDVQQAPVLEPVENKEPVPAPVRHAAEEDDDSGLPLFGYDVFSGNSLGLTVVDDLPVPLDYQMGPGDVINVQTFGKTNQNLSLTIDRDGSINLPDIGPVAVSGQTFAQLRKQINDVIKKKTIGVDVSVTMGAMRTMQVYIVGEAAQPGAYNVNGLTTITQALIASGGVKKSGSLRHIQLIRKGQVVSEFDLYDLLIKGDTSKDLRLSSGDTLFIPIRDNALTIEGQVARPAVYETKGGTTLAQLLSLAGGAKPNAYLSRVSVRRTSTNGVQQFTLDLSSPSGRGFKLENGDKVNLSAVSKSLKNAVAVRGEVVRQGALNFKQGMKVSDAIGSIEDGLKQTADLNYALLVREVNANQDIEVYQFSLLDAITHRGSAANLTLQEKDQIFVFDNGLAQDYWFGSYANSKVKSTAGSDKTREVLDTETGAVITKEESTALKVPTADAVSDAAELRKASREALLKPIIERLKEQASYGSPAKVIEVSGAVKFPGLYPLAKNTNVSSLIAAAGGLNQDAYLTSAELSRRLMQGDKATFERIDFSLKDAISGKYPVSLGAQDTLIVKTQPGWQEGIVVELQGEFVFPGTYTFKRGETLKDVVERAGGFTEYAYPEGAVFSRERLKRQEAERLKFINAQLKQEISTMSLRRQGSSVPDPAQAIAIVDQLENAQPVGRLVIDLNSAVEGDKLANLMLEKGDKLFVPAVNPVVSVVGEVQFTSNHTFNPNLTVEDYITSAGGTKRQADTDRIYIVKSNGSVELPNNSFWFSRNYEPLEPGDTIIVPVNTDYLDGLSTLSTATQILYQIGVAWSAVKN